MKKLEGLRVVFGALLVVSLMLSLTGSALAHKASLRVDAVESEDGSVGGVAYLEPPHGNSPIIFKLFKKKADGTWAFVQKIVERQQMSDGVYVVYFDKVAGDKRCKVKAIFKKDNHQTQRDTSDVVDC